ncbi:hypothetical protein KI387_009252, partial [Taxus chinensis]
MALYSTFDIRLNNEVVVMNEEMEKQQQWAYVGFFFSFYSPTKNCQWICFSTAPLAELSTHCNYCSVLIPTWFATSSRNPGGGEDPIESRKPPELEETFCCILLSLETGKHQD